MRHQLYGYNGNDTTLHRKFVKDMKLNLYNQTYKKLK